MTRVAVFVGTRADLGPLESVLAALADAEDIDLHLLCGVAFGGQVLRQRLMAINALHAWRVVELTRPLTNAVTSDELLRHGPRLAEGMAEAIRREAPDVLVVLGDRWELLFVVPPAYLAEVAIVHLHGGEITEGAIDERVRHAVSKLADLHCVASTDALARLLQLGEPPERVVETGAPGLDRLAGIPRLDLDSLSELVEAPLARPVALFTYHPPTATEDAPLARWSADALRATAENCGSVIATHPGMDPGRDSILSAVEQVAAEHSNIVLIESLGSRYPAALASVDLVVGNSSSGVIETATLGIPTVNVGERQRGRLHGRNVIHANEGYEDVVAAVRHALAPHFLALSRHVDNPYGDGKAAERILAAVRRAGDVGRGKPFHDSKGKP